MLDAAAQTRFNKSCSDAAFGYMTAAGAAYVAVCEQWMQAWSAALEDASPKARPAATPARSWYREPVAEPKSWYREPKGAARASGPSAADCFMPWAGASGGAQAGNPFATMMPFAAMNPFLALAQSLAPFTPWGMMTESRQPAAWPMAYGMIAAGVPKTVAWPAAEANIAAMDAISTAAGSVERAMVSYRSAEGHAVTRVVSPGTAAMPMMLAFMIVPFSPQLLLRLMESSRAAFAG